VLRVGGLPAWRSYLRFQPLAGLRIPCGPGQPETCTVPLADATINLASLMLDAVPAGPRRVELPLFVEGRAVLEGAGVALVRAPLTPPVGPPTDSLSPGIFAEPSPEATVRVPITSYIRFHVNPDDVTVPLWLGLNAIGERGQFGYAAFGGMDSERPPRLRLMVSVSDEVLVR
jgi:hypothetical protein